MIKLFEKTATSFETNGIGLLTNYIFDPKVKEERNGYFAFTFKIPLHTKYGVQIAGEMIVTADCPGVGEQPFRIQKVIPSMGILSVEANHIFYDLADNFIEDINIVGANGQRAGQHILDNTAFPHNFTFRSDLANNYNCRIVRYNPVEAFLDDSKDNTFVSRWGGEIKRDKYEIIMNNMRGTDRGVRISNRKNLTGYEATIDYETVVTRIVPQGYDGLMLPEIYVDSPLIGQYTHPKIAVVQYAQIKAQTESEPKEDELPLEEAYEELRRLAALEFSEHHVDEPKATYKINFIDLRKTTEYKDFEHLEEILPWDWVTVEHEEDNLHVKARLQSYTWDPLLGMYVELILGSVKSTVSGSMGKDVDYQDQIDQIREISNSAMKSADGKNTIFYGLYGEDGLGEPTANKIGDLWFKPEDDETVTKQWDGNAWITISSTAPDPELVEAIEEVGKEVEQAQSDSATALENANSAVNKANEASAKAEQSQQTAEQAKSDATNAAGKAQSALDSAGQAVSSATDALNQANLAKSQAEEAINKYLGMGMVPAWSWSPDGTDRFTTVEPGENLLLLSKLENGSYDYETGVPTSGQDLKRNTVPIEVDKTASYVVSNAKPAKAMRFFFYDANGGFISVTESINANTYKLVVPSNATTINYIFWAGASTNESYKFWKLEKGINPTIYTPSPSEDYTNAVPSYIGFAIEPSDNPADYTWMRNPEKVEGEVKVELTEINGELSRKVSQETFDQLNGTVVNHSTLISQNQNEIKQKASQESVNTLTGRVTSAEGSITTLAGQVALKANQTEVDTIAGRVTSAESQLTVQAGKISGLTSLTDGHTTKIGALELQAGQFSLSLSSVQNDLNGLEIGGRNYFSVNAWKNRPSFSVSSIPAMKIIVEPNTEYIMSTNIPNWADKITCDLFVFHSSGAPSSTSNGVALNKPRKVTTLADGIIIVAMRNKEFNSGTWWAMLSKGNKALDWTPAPEDMATVTALTTIQATVDGLAITVANKANQSQVTQLANQITSVVSDVSAIDKTLNWQKLTTGQNLNTMTTTGRYFVASGGNTNAPANADRWFYLTVDNTSGRIKQEYQDDYDVTGKFFRMSNNNGETWLPWQRVANQSQITQLTDAINLRVIKNDIINQININDQGVLIAGQKVHITGQTTIDSAVIKTAHIADAAITSAKIGSLSADKITVGTLNGGNVNIINLNADNIVSGTISGQNLSINLTSGEVMFTKGSIRNADATFVMDIVTGVVSSRGTVLSPNSTGDLLPTGFDLMNGKLQFMNGSYGETSVVYGGIDTNTHYGQVLNSSSSWISGNYFSNAPTLVVNSGDQTNSVWQSWKKNVALGTTDFKELPMLSSGVKAGLGLTGSKKAYDQNIIGGSMGIVSNATSSVCPDGFAQTKAVIQARNGIYMSSGFHYQVSGNSVSILTPASIRIGDTTNDNGSADAQKQSAASIFAQGHTFTFKGDTADLWANHHKLRGLYSATKSASANIYLDTDGSLYRATSARKYKTAITIADDVIQHAKKVLSIQPSSWFDKSELGQPTLERRYGFIADEFHEAGLREVVVYNKNEIESLAYDRIPMYHNVILNEHEQRIQDLENEVKKLKTEIEGLKAA